MIVYVEYSLHCFNKEKARIIVELDWVEFEFDKSIDGRKNDLVL